MRVSGRWTDRTRPLHIQAYAPNGTLAAYARILPPHDAEPPHIGRVIVHPSFPPATWATPSMHHALTAVAAMDRGAARSRLRPIWSRSVPASASLP